MLSKIIQFVKIHQDDIILAVGVVLISLLSFSMGYIIAKQQEKEPIKIEYNPNLRMKSESTNSIRIAHYECAHPNIGIRIARCECVFGAFGYDSDGIRIILCG